MGEIDPPGEVLVTAGLSATGATCVGRGDRVWMAATSTGPLVLRRTSRSDAKWLHPILEQFSGAFAVPEPVPLFTGRSFLDQGERSWEALSWLPGREIGFADRPSLQEVGAFLGRFHEVSLQRTANVQPRPRGLPLTGVAAVIDWRGATVTMGSREAVAELRAMVERFDADLAEVGYRTLRRCVVHGDPTTFNVLADGEPAVPTGLIDFELADVEPPIADVAFCLWRSGRRHQSSGELCLDRVRDLMAGYRSVRDVTDRQIAALPVALRGRGLQMLAKRTRRSIPDHGPLNELRWIDDHTPEILTAAAGRG